MRPLVKYLLTNSPVERQQVLGLYLSVAGQPRLGLSDGVVVEVLPVRHRNIILAQLAQDIVGQLVDGIGHRNVRYLFLHRSQLIQRDGGGDLPGPAGLLVPQDGQPLVPVLDVRRHHLQLQPVVQGLQDFLLGVAEIGNFVRRRKEGDGGDTQLKRPSHLSSCKVLASTHAVRL